MNERLFIDWVDTEWCWRANCAGYKIICNTDNIIYHSMGDNYKVVFDKKIVVYSNFRNYFFFRNGVYLLFHSHLLTKGEHLSFFKFMIEKSILFFITKGMSWRNIVLFNKAILKGLFNNFTLEESIK